MPVKLASVHCCDHSINGRDQVVGFPDNDSCLGAVSGEHVTGTRGLKRDLIIDLETSALTPDRGEIIHYRAINRWDEDDVLDEWGGRQCHCPQKLSRSLERQTKGLKVVGQRWW
jgi:hypothetical protein